MGPELCVGGIAVVNEHLLLIQRATEPGRGHWSLPGGRVERGELLQQAVVREMREETGLAFVCEELVGWVERIDDTHHFVIFDFAVTLLDDNEPVAGDDAAAVAWVALHEVAERPLVAGLAEFLADHDVIRTFT